MQPQSYTEYQQLLTEVIKKQIVILGPDITLIKARNVPGLVVDDTGTVTQITGEPQQITQSLIDQFVQLSGLIVKKTMEPLLAYHAGNPATIAAAARVIPIVQPIPTTPIQSGQTPMPSAAQPARQAEPGIAGGPVGPIQTSNPPVAQPPEDVHNQIDSQTQAIIDEAVKQA